MATITLKGTPCSTSGDLIAQGESISDFHLTNSTLETLTLSSFSGNTIILNCFPSIDTPVCANSVRKFNEEAAALNGVKVLCVSQDLPFALNRFCSGEGIENVVPASAFRDKEFGKQLGILITDGPLEGLFARAVVVINDAGSVLYSQLVPEIAEEPDYAAALKAVQG